ncbi:MAG: phosphatase PAP2 family protein [Bacteroidota bacterium]|nr:phosphatase PAP2 family protein [Bacteroidota bacterium]MDP4196556.1 phosphatase PAP2 family protein [Bacteroidota bacterium]
MKRISLSVILLCLSFEMNFSILNFNDSNIYAQIHSDSSSFSQEKKITSIDLIKNDLSIAVDDGVRLVKAPLHYNSSDWLTLGSVLGGTAVAFLADKEIRNMALRNHSHSLDNITKIGKTYGEAYTGAIISGVVYAGGLFSGDNEIRETGRMLFETLAYAGIITTVAKSIIGRSRPYTNEGAFRYRGFQFKTETTSLPSGHATVAFAVSSVLASRIDNLYASIGLYGLASLTVVQRIYDDKHWLSDTILGASIATIVGKTIVHYGEKRDKQDAKVFLYPSFSPMGNGFALQVGL